MKAYLYRWKIHGERESDFVAAWSQVTQSLRERGSSGSRLHRGDDGWWYAYALWPDAQTRARAFAEDVEVAAGERMRAAIAEALPVVALDPVADFLIPAA